MSAVSSNPIEAKASDRDNQYANQLMLVEVFENSDSSEFRFLRPPELRALTSKYRVHYYADVNAGTLARIPATQPASQEVINLPDVGTKAFLDGIETALNAMGSSTLAKKREFEKAHIGAISSQAMDAATDTFFDLMEKNIDRWTYDASSGILSSLAMQSSDNLIDQRREAADIQVKSKTFNIEFRAFFIESLVNFKCEAPLRSETTQPALELVSSDVWKSHNIEPLLAREYEGQTKVEFSQLNRRLGVLLDRSLHPDENVLGPKAIAWTLSQALNECGYSKKQREVLEPIIIADFNSALESLYSKINQIWIDLDILPDAKLEILKSDVA